MDTIKFVENRYTVIEGLKQIVYDLNEYANERDHVQKIIEQHYWIFGEQYNLVTADQRMQKALEQYVYMLYGDDKPDAVLDPDEEEKRRMDIFMASTRKTEDADGSEIEENLIVELKAPKVQLTKKVMRQIEDYMEFIHNQPRFNSQYRKWKFIAVCSSVDEYIKNCYKSCEGSHKKGLVRELDNYELYAMTWDDVFKSFDLRHDFLLKQLKIDRDKIAEEISSEIGDKPSRETADNLTEALCG